MKFKIQADEELFNKFKLAGLMVTNLGNIVQNDYELTPQEVAEWAKDVGDIINAISGLRGDVLTHVYKDR